MRKLTKKFLQKAAQYTACAFFYGTTTLLAQGVLSVTPGRSVVTNAGTGIVDYNGDGGTATSASLASPSAAAYDTDGNLYIADAQNHVVRKVSGNGTITTVAGNGIAGFGGDGANATQAYLDTPTGVAIDGNGNLYIADSHNNRIRKVANGVISTIAGTATAGFSGDGGAATSAQLSLPSSIGVDAAGNLYIADTNNQRIRKVTNNTISTVAGNGEEIFAGDGGPATAASLDSPTGIAVDASGKIYIADRHNHRIRVIDGTGTISTFAGSSTVTFAGSYSGDGTNATAALLAKPSGVSVDAAGNVYIADTNNQRIRQVGNRTIATIAGTGQQGFAGDNGAATSALLNSPRNVTSDASGNLAITDTLNARIRGSKLPKLVYANQAVGTASTPQSVTLTNSGNAPITVSQIAFTGAFTTATGGTCSTAPILLAPGSHCTQNIAYLPVASGPADGSVDFTGPGITPQRILLNGTAAQSTTTIAITTNASPSLSGQPVVLTATVAAAGSATGAVTFHENSIVLGTQPLISGLASLTTSALSAGSHNITADYSGDSNFTGSSSLLLSQVVQDFSISPVPATGETNKIVLPGQKAIYQFSLRPVSGAFTFPITLSSTGLPTGATAEFSQQTITPGTTESTFLMVITAPKVTSLLHGTLSGSGILAAIILVPLFGSACRKNQKMKPLLPGTIVFIGLAAITGLTGCGSNNGLLLENPKDYTITVTGTATGPQNTSLQHSTSVRLTVRSSEQTRSSHT